MAIHDVDKQNGDRSTPSPNTHDTQAARMAHGTNSTNYTTDATAASTNTPIKMGFKRLVASNIAVVANNGSTTTTTTSPHGLGYAPLVEASINNATVSGVGSGVNVGLPTFLSAAIDAPDQAVLFGAYIYWIIDATNVYFQLLNATGSPVTIAVTYYLYQQTAQ